MNKLYLLTERDNRLAHYFMVFWGLENQATRYVSQHIWCLSQARINWEGCVWKASGIKMMEMVGTN